MDSREDIEKELNNFFENLLNEATEDKTEAIGKITKHIPKLITPDQNSYLCKHIFVQDV